MKNLSFMNIFLICCFALSSLVYSADQSVPMPNGSLPPLTAEDLDMFNEIFKNMDDETLEALAKIGEEYIKEMEAQGKDPFEIFNQPFEGEIPQVPQQPAPEIKVPKAPEVVVPAVDTRKIETARAMLKSIIDKLSEIRQKAESSRKTATLIHSWKHLIDDIIYYAHTIAHDKIIKYFIEKDSEHLYGIFKQLEHDLTSLAPYINIPEVSLEGENPYEVLGLTPSASWQTVHDTYQKLFNEKNPQRIKQQLTKQGIKGDKLIQALNEAEAELDGINEAYQAILTKEQAHQALESVIDSLSRAVRTDHLIEESKKLMQKYEPEALKIKEQQEKLEAEARKLQDELVKKRPPYTPPIFEQFIPGGSTYRSTEDRYTGTPSYPSYPSYPSPRAESGLDTRLKPSEQPLKPGVPGAPTTPPSDKKGKGKEPAIPGVPGAKEGKAEEPKKTSSS